MSFAAPATVEDLLNYRLNRLLVSSGAMVTRLCEGRYGITRREWRMICLLATRGPMSPSELAEYAHLERARVSHHVAGLLRKGLVVRLPHETDRRRARIELHPSGHALHAELFPQSVAFNNQILQSLEAGQRALLDQLLTQLTQAAEALCHSRPVEHKADRRRGGSRRVVTSAAPARLW